MLHKGSSGSDVYLYGCIRSNSKHCVTDGWESSHSQETRVCWCIVETMPEVMWKNMALTFQNMLSVNTGTGKFIEIWYQLD